MPSRLRSGTRAVAAQRAGSRERIPVDGPADGNANAREPSPTAASTPTYEVQASILGTGNSNLGNSLHVDRDTAGDKEKAAQRPPKRTKHPPAPMLIPIENMPRSYQRDGGVSVSRKRSVETGSGLQGAHASYGRYCSRDKTDRIDTWVNGIAHPGDLEDASTPTDTSSALYKDWLDWSKRTALSWLRRLDRYEERFRTASLKYHKLPYQVRHSSKALHGSSVEQVVLNRLSGILETDRARSQQAFFVPWLEMKTIAVNILDDMKFYQPLPDDCEFLRTVLRKFELSLCKMPKACRTLLDGLHWLEDAVAAVLERSDLDGSEALASAFTREGGIIRRWIQTLPELDSEVMEMKSRYIEWYTERLLDVGVEKDQYWSGMADMGGSQGMSPES